MFAQMPQGTMAMEQSFTRIAAQILATRESVRLPAQEGASGSRCGVLCCKAKMLVPLRLYRVMWLALMVNCSQVGSENGCVS